MGEGDVEGGAAAVPEERAQTLRPPVHRQGPPRRGRVDGYADLRSYAAIGDGRTVALVARDGSIDWLPLPGLDDSPVFAALLDAEHGGCITLAPDEDHEVTREYVPATNVLVTTFTAASGVVRLTDSLNTGLAGRLPWVELARRVDGVAGRVPMSWRVAPGTSLGRASPWVDPTVHGPVLRVDGVTMAVRTLGEQESEVGEQAVGGRLTTWPGSRHLVGLTAAKDEPLHVAGGEEMDERVDLTIASWQRWVREFSYDGPWGDCVRRSALALKLLIHAPTGAVAAAATTSLPETLDGGKNWDYRYAWIRDTTFTLSALFRSGVREETHAALSWLLGVIREHGPQLDVFYRLDGGLPGGQRRADVPGWRDVGPVVAGNGAAGQLQLGVFGELFRVVRQHVDAGNVLDEGSARLLVTAADRACDVWQRPDAGIWELHTDRHYTSSKMGCWQALTSAAHLADSGQMPGDPMRWRAEARRIREWVGTHCWSEEKGAYLWYAGGDGLDASVLLHATSGFDRGPRMSSTIDALVAELGDGPLLHRYSGMPGQEGAFVACSFWAVSALATVGRRDEARALMDEMVGLVNDVGLLSEMIDTRDQAFLGNLPQGLSHLSLIDAAMNLADDPGPGDD